MFSADDFFNLLSQRKRALDRAPIFSPDELLTLESAYRVIHDLTDNARSPSSRRRRARVRLRLRIIRSLGAVLFVLVGVSVSVTDLASPKHDDIFPRLEHWWRNNPPSQQFADRAVELLHALDERRVRGDLEKRRGLIFHFIECNDRDC